MHIAELMRERPDTWGLRGDPHLWDEMEQSLVASPIPNDRAVLEQVLKECFERSAGVPLESQDAHFIPRFDIGGMSSGYVSPEFWRTRAIPLLLDRAEYARSAYGIADLLQRAKDLAREYRSLTGKPLGITGEVAEFAAAQALGLTLASAREAGYDATRYVDGQRIRVQIKGRCLAEGAKRGQRVGGIKIDQPWDTVLLVVLDEQFDPVAMYEAQRDAVVAALTTPGSRARNERGALSIEKFRSISTRVWSRPDVSGSPGWQLAA